MKCSPSTKQTYKSSLTKHLSIRLMQSFPTMNFIWLVMLMSSFLWVGSRCHQWMNPPDTTNFEIFHLWDGLFDECLAVTGTLFRWPILFRLLLADARYGIRNHRANNRGKGEGQLYYNISVPWFLMTICRIRSGGTESCRSRSLYLYLSHQYKFLPPVFL